MVERKELAASSMSKFEADGWKVYRRFIEQGRSDEEARRDAENYILGNFGEEVHLVGPPPSWLFPPEPLADVGSHRNGSSGSAALGLVSWSCQWCSHVIEARDEAAMLEKQARQCPRCRKFDWSRAPSAGSDGVTRRPMTPEELRESRKARPPRAGRSRRSVPESFECLPGCQFAETGVHNKSCHGQYYSSDERLTVGSRVSKPLEFVCPDGCFRPDVENCLVCWLIAESGEEWTDKPVSEPRRACAPVSRKSEKRNGRYLPTLGRCSHCGEYVEARTVAEMIEMQGRGCPHCGEADWFSSLRGFG